MSVGERDPHTGHMTTGHQWNGIKELNTKVPKPVWIFLSIAFAVSLVMWILFPTWPLVTTYTKGLLGADDKVELSQQLSGAASMKDELHTKILAVTYEEALKSRQLINYIRSAGRPLFDDNCSACHGVRGTGGPGYPNLADKAWLWLDDGEPLQASIMQTLKVGINSGHEDTRVSQMSAFGKDETLDRKSVSQVIDYVLSLNENPPVTSAAPEQVKAGAKLFNENCASCHGENAKGNHELGAPNLTDTSWIYGGTRQALHNTIWNGRQGEMPSWQARLSKADRKLLTLYILDLGSKKE